MAGKPIPMPLETEDKNSEGEIVLSISDIERLASRKLPRKIREFYNSGSTNQETIRENSTAFTRYRLRSRVLIDVSNVDTSTAVFGSRTRFPLGISPAGVQAMAHPAGELATSRACARKGVNMGISSFANFPIADIRSAGLDVNPSINHAIQLYTMRDRKLQEHIIRTAESQGCKALLLTADSPVLGVRYSEVKNDFRVPGELGFPNIGITSDMIQKNSHNGMFDAFNNPSHSWEREIPWLRSRTKMEIWIKGVICAEDVELAIQHGCDGVLVSNHGGRQLDGVPASLDALMECAATARGRIRIHVDGGIRSGSDIFKALALGAECCWVGRPAIWGLAVDGEKGVQKVLEILEGELRMCMQLCGCRRVEDITPQCLRRINADGILCRL